MKSKLLILILTHLMLLPFVNAQEPIRHLIISKWNGAPIQYAFAQLTNVGDSSIDLSNFTFTNVNASIQATSVIAGVPFWNYGPRYSKRLSGRLEPGESYLIMNVYDAIMANGLTYQLPKMLPLADVKVHVTETTTPHPIAMPELEVYGYDSISVHDFLLRHHSGHHASILYYRTSETDSVAVDQVNLAYDPALNKLIERASAVAGVTDASFTHYLVRKANIKSGNTNWDNARGISAEDSEWLALPKWQGRTPYTTLKNFGDFHVVVESSVANVNQDAKTITVEWGTERGDSILKVLTLGPGMGWQYLQSPGSADSSYNTIREGDIFQAFACGNELRLVDFEMKVAPPAPDNAKIFPLRNYSFVTGYWSMGSRYYVTKDNPVIDTIGNVPFATRVDTLLAYLEKAPNANWEFIWVDNQERVDLKNGDKLKVTAENGTTVKEYFIDVLEYTPSSNANLSAITWPDIPFFLDGWRKDTIPMFYINTTSYSVTIPFGTTSVPALRPTPSNLRAKIQTTRATSLTGSLQERTTVFKVTAEDDSTIRQYSVIFNLEKPDEFIQKFYGHPFISEVVTNMNSHMSFLEIYNPRNVPIDLSEYMVVRSLNTLNPAQALAGSIPPAEDANFQHRYRSYIPGYKYSDDLETWKLSPGKIYIDPDVDPFLEPGETFVIGKAQTDRRVLFGTQAIEDAVDKWFDGGSGQVTVDGVNIAQTVANLKRNAVAVFLFRITNDSIFNGTKQVGDPNDFELVDAFGGGATAGADPWVIAGKSIGNASNQAGGNSRVRLKPHVYQGVLVPGQNAGTNADDSDWIVEQQPADIAMGNMPDYLGSHEMNVVTVHLSIISSLTYLVSDGYEELQTVQGDLAAKTLEQFYLNISKADPDQDLSLRSHTDGSVKLPEDLVSDGDTLIVVSANGENTTKYLLVNQPLNNNAVLTAADGSGLTIAINGSTGTISGMEYGTTLKVVLEKVIKPELAVLHIIDENDHLVPLRLLNYDTVYVDVVVSDRYFFEVVAQDGVTKITYQLVPAALSSDAFVTSSIYTVDQDSLIISGIPFSTSVPVFFENITVVRGASAFIEDKNKFLREIGWIAFDDRLVVTSEDQSTSVTYYLDFLTETNPDRVGDPTHTEYVKQYLGQLVIYPNPVSERFYVKDAPENATFHLTDLMGRTISITRAAEIYNGISLADHAAGIYLLIVKGNNQVIGHARIIKQ